MSDVVVIGSQWGDEGKGKIVDLISEQADIIVRFQGGNNAGHTIVIDGKEYRLSLLPSGIIRKGKLSIVGNGVVLDPWSFLKEVKLLLESGIEISPENLQISYATSLILPIHTIIDNAREQNKGSKKIGTTGRGIGPAYEDKASRRGVRVCDLLDKKILKEKINNLVLHHNIWLKAYDLETVSHTKIFNELVKISDEILNFSKDVWVTIDKAHKEGKRILYEGAQGIMLDIDHGTYPYVTSSSTVPAQAAIGSGSNFSTITKVLGITKAYCTRVGSGPFPSEEINEDGDLMGTKGKEFGTVTGRKRRCGWIDIVMLKKAVKISGINGLVLTKLDVLDDFKEIKICVGYEIKNKKINFFPNNLNDQFNIKPVYKIIPGWKQSTFGLKNFSDLPKNAQNYIRVVESLIECPIDIISTSPEREDTILLNHPF